MNAGVALGPSLGSSALSHIIVRCHVSVSTSSFDSGKYVAQQGSMIVAFGVSE
jgi:hypothetical protein